MRAGHESLNTATHVFTHSYVTGGEGRGGGHMNKRNGVCQGHANKGEDILTAARTPADIIGGGDRAAAACPCFP